MTKPIDQEQVLKAELARLPPGGFILFDDKRALGRWHDTIQSMKARGMLQAEMVAIDEQSTQLRLFAPTEPRRDHG